MLMCLLFCLPQPRRQREYLLLHACCRAKDGLAEKGGGRGKQVGTTLPHTSLEASSEHASCVRPCRKYAGYLCSGVVKDWAGVQLMKGLYNDRKCLSHDKSCAASQPACGTLTSHSCTLSPSNVGRMPQCCSKPLQQTTGAKTHAAALWTRS